MAMRRSNLATILEALGEHGEARKQIELALESDLRQLGPDHPKVAVSRWTLAAILHSLKEREAALQEIDLALEIFRKLSSRPVIRTFARPGRLAGQDSRPPRGLDLKRPKPPLPPHVPHD